MGLEKGAPWRNAKWVQTWPEFCKVEEMKVKRKKEKKKPEPGNGWFEIQPSKISNAGTARDAEKEETVSEVIKWWEKGWAMGNPHGPQEAETLKP